MYTRQQTSLLKQAFWTAFGKYMAPVPAADGGKTNWINYKTGVKHLHFSMQAEREQAAIAIVLTNPNPVLQEEDFQKLFALKPLLEEQSGEAWNWQQGIKDEQGANVSIISLAVENVNVFSENDWPAIISFLKPRIIALDAFWQLAKDLF